MAIAIARRPPKSRLRRREAIAGYLFVLPWVVSLIVFAAYPVIGTVYFSFTNYDVINPAEWVGFDNYQSILTDDPAFRKSVWNSAYYAVISVPIRLLLALLLALALNMSVRGIGVYRTIFYLPALAPPVVGATIFVLMLNPDVGPVNAPLRALGLPSPDWLGDPNWSKPALILLSLWPLGVETLIFLAGLKDIPQDLMDAAAIDGAGPWRRFRGVVLPMLSPVVLFNLVIGVIFSFQVFTQALVVGGRTGNPLESTLVYVVLIYRTAFRDFAMGYAAALSVLLFLAVVLMTLLIFRSARRWVYYEGGER